MRLKQALLAVCLAAVITAGVLALIFFHGKEGRSVTLGGVERHYRDVSAVTRDIGILWPWEALTVSEQYTEMTFQGQRYQSRGQAVDESLLEGPAGVCEAVGYDEYTEERHQRSFDVYRIRGLQKEQLAAVEMDGAYYVFLRDEYREPETLGELLDSYNLKENVELERFSIRGENGKEQYYALEDDGALWELLTLCKEAESVSGAEDKDGGEVISFTVTSEPLGVYKRVLEVSEEGILSTNLLDRGFAFDIGKKAAGELLSLARSGAEKAEYEPYMETLAGTVTEVGEDYIRIDDSILCEDENDGMEFLIPAEDIRIRRCVEHLELSGGELVAVDFTGKIEREHENRVQGAVSLSEAFLSEGEALIPE